MISRRKFINGAVAAAVSAALPASATTSEPFLVANPKVVGRCPYKFEYSLTGRQMGKRAYQQEALKQMQLYGSAAARVWPNNTGKTFMFETMNYAEIETRVLSHLENKESIQGRLAKGKTHV